MNKKLSKYKVLAPVGSLPNLHAALDAGADEIYLGLKDLNMRSGGAKNFTLTDLKKVRKICNTKNPSKKVKICLTLNTIIYENEFKKLENIIKKISKNKLVDAVICWDLSVIQLCRKYKVPFHISTQASISNSKALEFYAKLGAERVVLARELSLKQIKSISKIAKKLKVEIETFCHGAMCVSISGRCFTSQFLQNKSANRGMCTHPCRRAYTITDATDPSKQLRLQNNRVMSAKDLCTLPFINKLKEAGITVFKIEGRNRSLEYVNTTTRIYKQAIEKKSKLTPNEIKKSINELRKVYNRGFSSGFYIKTPTNDDFSSSENGEQTESKEYIARIEKIWPKVNVAKLKLHHKKISVNDEIFIIGDDTGIKRMQVESLEIENKQVKQAKKGQEVGLKLPKDIKAKKGDEVYLINKN